MNDKKIMFLGDLHLGVKNFNIEYFKNSQKPFLMSCIDYCKDNNIEYIFQLGDLFDNRSTTNIIFMNEILSFFDYMKQSNIKMITLLGNHDISLYDSREFSLSKIISLLYDNIELIENQTLKKIGSKNFLFTPWLLKNEKIDPGLIVKSDVILGHFEIAGFNVTKSTVSDSDMTPQDFSNKEVYSGHFHIPQKRSKINYIGTPYQLTWNDYKSVSSAIIYDTKDSKIEYLFNDISPKHLKIKYNNGKIEIDGVINQGKHETIECDVNTILNYKDLITSNFIKVYINADDKNEGKYDELIYVLSSFNINFDIINNVFISDITHTDYINSSNKVIDVEKYIISKFKGYDTSTIPIIKDLLKRAKEGKE